MRSDHSRPDSNESGDSSAKRPDRRSPDSVIGYGRFAHQDDAAQDDAAQDDAAQDGMAQNGTAQESRMEKPGAVDSSQRALEDDAILGDDPILGELASQLNADATHLAEVYPANDRSTPVRLLETINQFDGRSELNTSGLDTAKAAVALDSQESVGLQSSTSKPSQAVECQYDSALEQSASDGSTVKPADREDNPNTHDRRRRKFVSGILGSITLALAVILFADQYFARANGSAHPIASHDVDGRANSIMLRALPNVDPITNVSSSQLNNAKVDDAPSQNVNTDGIDHQTKSHISTDSSHIGTSHVDTPSSASTSSPTNASSSSTDVAVSGHLNGTDAEFAIDGSAPQPGSSYHNTDVISTGVSVNDSQLPPIQFDVTDSNDMRGRPHWFASRETQSFVYGPYGLLIQTLSQSETLADVDVDGNPIDFGNDVILSTSSPNVHTSLTTPQRMSDVTDRYLFFANQAEMEGLLDLFPRSNERPIQVSY